MTESFDSDLQRELLKAPAENRTIDKLAEGFEVRIAAKSTALHTDATGSLSPKSYFTEDSQASAVKVTQLYKRFKRDKFQGPMSDWHSDHLLMTEDGSQFRLSLDPLIPQKGTVLNMIEARQL